jgi:hypothetical protein
MTVAEASERKSSVQNVLLRDYHKFFHERDLERAYIEDLENYSYEVSAWESGMKKAKKSDNNGDVSTSLLENNKPLEPVDPRIFIDDITQEGLFYKLSYGRLPLAGIWSAEAGTLFRCVGMTGDNVGKVYFMLNKFWSNESVTSTRKQSRGVQSIHHSVVSLNLAMQNSVFSENVATNGNSEIGFLARVLMCKPRKLAGTRLMENIKEHREKYPKGEETDLDRFTGMVGSNLINIFNQFIESREMKFADISLTEEAEALVGEKYDEIERAQGVGGKYELHSAFAGKMIQHMLRIAVNIMWITRVGGKSLEVGEIESAYRVVCWYMDNHIRFMQPNSLASERFEAKVSSIITYIKEQERDRLLYNISYKELRTMTSLCKCEHNKEAEHIIQELIDREVLIDRRRADDQVVIEGEKVSKYFEINKVIKVPTYKADPNDSHIINSFD